MGFGGRVNLWYQTVQQGNFFAVSICPNSSFPAHLEAPCSILWRPSSASDPMPGEKQWRRNTPPLFTFGSEAVAIQGSTLAPPSFPAQDGMVVQKGPAPASAHQERCCSTAEVGKHKARGKHQRGKQDLTQRGEKINLMMFSSCSSSQLSCRAFFLTLACQEQKHSSVLSPMPSNPLNKDIFS